MAWTTPINWLAKAVGYDVTRADLQTISDSLAALGVPTQATAYTPEQMGWAADPAFHCAYAISGNLLTLWLSAVGTSNEEPTRLSLPGGMVVRDTLPVGYFTGGIDFLCRIIDSGGGLAVGLASAYPAVATITFSKDIDGTAFTIGGGKAVVATLTVPI